MCQVNCEICECNVQNILIILCFLYIFSCHPEPFLILCTFCEGVYVVENCLRIENFSDRNGNLIIGPTYVIFQFRMPEFSRVTAGQPKGFVLDTQQQKVNFSIKSIQALGSPTLPSSWYWGLPPQGQSSQALFTRI